ncbi:hypothetical protein QQZ08_001074 [Neonectria magnoliae]|uniref:Alcohol dehydrogenase N-terminal domain-containing protein n=1 Tax=Neonectria magnoliae TaxID=2732573 RepID=A0ABR1IGU2_9HYPO
MSTMKAAIIHVPSGPEALRLETVPIPTPQRGEVITRIRAFGFNRSELFTRQGHSPGSAAALASGHGAQAMATTRRNQKEVAELIGTVTLEDSMQSAKKGDEWTLNGWNPMESIPSGVYLTTFSGGRDDFIETSLSDMARQIKAGKLKLQIGHTFTLDEITDAHKLME